MSDSLNEYHLDFNDDLFISSLAIVHQRFSTNTFSNLGTCSTLQTFMSQWRINTLRGM